MSIHSAADSVMASSELDFDFDSIVLNSTVYRRAFAKAKYSAATEPLEQIQGDLIDFSETDTLRPLGNGKDGSDVGELAIAEGLLGLRFSIAVGAPPMTGVSS
jgi:hypothetical protein